MERRQFLTGVLGIAGAATVASIFKPAETLAGMPANRPGILDELDGPAFDTPEEDATVEQVWHRDRPHHGWGRPRRRRRRRVWRRICQRYWRHGRWRRRCFRRRVWIFI